MKNIHRNPQLGPPIVAPPEGPVEDLHEAERAGHGPAPDRRGRQPGPAHELRPVRRLARGPPPARCPTTPTPSPLGEGARGGGWLLSYKHNSKTPMQGIFYLNLF